MYYIFKILQLHDVAHMEGFACTQNMFANNKLTMLSDTVFIIVTYLTLFQIIVVNISKYDF